jgi:hypothetical protein
MGFRVFDGRGLPSPTSIRAAVGVALSLVTMVLAPAAKAGVIDEVWAGGYAHDISDIDHRDHQKESNTQDIQLEVDTVQPRLLRFLGAPHLNAIVSLNTAGESQMASVGLAWDRRLLGPFYGSFQVGIGETDGVAQPPNGPAGDYDRRHRLLLGSKTLFREAAGLNWRVAPRWEVGVQFTHASNGLILGHRYNESINDLGMRLGYRFQ